MKIVIERTVDVCDANANTSFPLCRYTLRRNNYGKRKTRLTMKPDPGNLPTTELERVVNVMETTAKILLGGHYG